jgi:hypothetical protein
VRVPVAMGLLLVAVGITTLLSPLDAGRTGHVACRGAAVSVARRDYPYAPLSADDSRECHEKSLTQVGLGTIAIALGVVGLVSGVVVARRQLLPA